MSIASFFTSIAVGVLAAAVIASLNLGGAEGFAAASTQQLHAAATPVCLYTVF